MLQKRDLPKLAGWVIKRLEGEGVITGLPDPSDKDPSNNRYWLQLDIVDIIIKGLEKFPSRRI